MSGTCVHHRTSSTKFRAVEGVRVECVDCGARWSETAAEERANDDFAHQVPHRDWPKAVRVARWHLGWVAKRRATPAAEALELETIDWNIDHQTCLLDDLIEEIARDTGVEEGGLYELLARDPERSVRRWRVEVYGDSADGEVTVSCWEELLQGSRAKRARQDFLELVPHPAWSKATLVARRLRDGKAGHRAVVALEAVGEPIDDAASLRDLITEISRDMGLGEALLRELLERDPERARGQRSAA